MALRVATFNAGLAPGYLPNVTARLPHILDALADLARGIDVLYLQEVWLDDHYAAVHARLSPVLPHSMRQAPAHPPASGGCTQESLAPLLECAATHCAGLRDDALASCVVRHCARIGLTLPPACLQCIASNPRGTIEDIVARCLGPASTSPPQMHAYGGSYGTALFSRSRLSEAAELVYSATINARGAVHTVTAGTHIFATHFSPGSSDQSRQYEALVDWTSRLAPRPAPTIILGDLNTSPGTSLFRLLTNAGFREPDTIDRRGTWGHGLETGRADDAGWRIDHVLTRDVAGYVTSKRVLDQVITLDNRTRSTLSDHFGVLVTIE